MTKEEELERIGKEIKQAQSGYQNDKEWQAFDAALLALCGPLGNKSIRTVLPKVVAVDRIYTAYLIRYLPKPRKDERDIRLSFYRKLAGALVDINLDSRFSVLKEQSSHLSTSCLAEVVKIHGAVSQAVWSTTGRNGDVFASKYLHFCLPTHFPILDAKAERSAADILRLCDSGGKHVIVERFGHDQTKDKYNKFCHAVLAIQSALADAELGQYSLAELDRYLYWYRANSGQETYCG